MLMISKELRIYIHETSIFSLGDKFYPWGARGEVKSGPLFQIERNSVLGRFLVSTADLAAGQLIFNEAPILVGPRQLTKPVCLGCHKELKGPKEVIPCSR
jgi:hypothetical protein